MLVSGSAPMSGRSAGQRIAGHIPHAEHERQPQLGQAVVEERQLLGIRQPNRGIFTGRQVSELDREHIVTLLLEEGGAPALLERLLILLAGRPALRDDPVQRAVADLHLEARHH